LGSLLVPSDVHIKQPVNVEGSSKPKKQPKRHSFSEDMDAEWNSRLAQRKKKVKQIQYTPDWVEKMIQKKFHSSKNRKKLAAQGKALPNESYPIEDTEDLKNAATLARSGHGDVSAARRLISRRAKQLGAKNPLAEKVGKSAELYEPVTSCFSRLTE
jgi:hypothetical protein